MKNNIDTEIKLEELTRNYEKKVKEINDEIKKLPDDERTHVASTGFLYGSFAFLLATLISYFVGATLPVVMTLFMTACVAGVPASIFSAISTKSEEKRKLLEQQEKDLWATYCKQADEIKKEQFVFVEKESEQSLISKRVTAQEETVASNINDNNDEFKL